MQQGLIASLTRRNEHHLAPLLLVDDATTEAPQAVPQPKVQTLQRRAIPGKKAGNGKSAIWEAKVASTGVSGPPRVRQSRRLHSCSSA